MESTPLCEALKIALPLVFTTQVNTQLDTGNTDAVINTLQYMRKTNIDDALVPKILKIISTKHLTMLTPIQAKQTLFCVLDWKRSKETAALVPQLINILLQKMDVLDGPEIRAILLKLVKNYETEKDAEIAANYYNDAFLDACVGVAVGKDVGFNCALNILSNINFFRHSNTPLLDYIAAKCFEKPELLNNATKYDLKSILYGLSLAEYKPVFWETMKDSMMNKNLLDFPLPILTKICVYLMSLDCYWPELIEKIFTTFEIKHDDHSSLKTRFTIIHSAVKNDYPQYSGAWPNYEVIEKSAISPNLKEEHFEVLKTAVECSLGGPQYIHTNLSTKLGLIIDHVAIMRKGGFPIAINNHGDVKPTKVEDLQPPPDSQVILFYVTPYASCPRNTERLSGVWSLYIKQLALTTKATVIPIPKKKWLKFTEAEQIRYISQALRLKCDELSAVVN
uniref:RAP domain-containing protein n=1 Tax=Bracon brevicornis TaxID=1563983 RepID=A0A6V7MFC3_9HYME